MTRDDMLHKEFDRYKDAINFGNKYHCTIIALELQHRQVLALEKIADALVGTDGEQGMSAMLWTIADAAIALRHR